MSRIEERRADHRARSRDFDSQLLAGWRETKMTLDRSLFTLSSGGLGLIVHMLSTTRDGDPRFPVLLVLAAAAFLGAAMAVLLIFHRNSLHIEKVANEQAGSDPVLGMLDWFARTSFVVGAFLAFASVAIPALSGI